MRAVSTYWFLPSAMRCTSSKAQSRNQSGLVVCARLDDLGRMQARLVHLRLRIEAGLDQVLQHLVGAGAGGGQVDVWERISSAPCRGRPAWRPRRGSPRVIDLPK